MIEEKKGTTTVGIVVKEGVVFAADKRATMGYFIANKDVDKILEIDDKMAMTTAGSVGDAQTLARYMKAEVALFKNRNEKDLTINGAATLLANILQQYKFFPFYVQILIGGVNPDGKGDLYNLDPIGGMTKEKYTSTGSGSPMAFGVLESKYKENIDLNSALKLAAESIAIAMKRDAGTGEGVDLLLITKDGIKRYAKEEVNKMLES